MTKKYNENKYTIRLDNHTALKLDELTKSLNISYNLLIRTIIQDFLVGNESHLNNIIDEKNNSK